MRNSEKEFVLPIWLRKLGRVREGIKGSRQRTAQEGVAETVLLMVMAHNRLKRQFGDKGLQKRIHFLQTVGNAFSGKSQ